RLLDTIRGKIKIARLEAHLDAARVAFDRDHRSTRHRGGERLRAPPAAQPGGGGPFPPPPPAPVPAAPPATRPASGRPPPVRPRPGWRILSPAQPPPRCRRPASAKVS